MSSGVFYKSKFLVLRRIAGQRLPLEALKMEARVGIEPTIEDLQSSALPLGDRALVSFLE